MIYRISGAGTPHLPIAAVSYLYVGEGMRVGEDR